jgi:transposase InsO family protein
MAAASSRTARPIYTLTGTLSRLPAKVVIEVLEQVFSERGGPEYLRSDNGPEFNAEAIQRWLNQPQVQPHYIKPGSPWQNAYGESFNGKFRDECLNMEVSYSLAEAAAIVEIWRQSYNSERPHSSLGYRTPVEFAETWRLVSNIVEQSPQVRRLATAAGFGVQRMYGNFLAYSINLVKRS